MGDTQYNHNGDGEEFFAGDVYEIRWDHESNPTSYVKLKYSSDGGLTWDLITDNTPNDGVYDWVVPSSIASTECRVRTIVNNASDEYAGSDASTGNFMITAGGSIELLTNNNMTSASTDPDYYRFIHNYSTWCVVGVRSADQWKMQMFSDATFTPPDIASSSLEKPVNFIVIDGHHTASAMRGIKANRVTGTSTATVEYEGGNEVLTVGAHTGLSWSNDEFVKIWDVHLAPGQYQFSLITGSSVADYGIALFGSGGTSYFGNRASNLAISDNAGDGGDESFTINITSEDIYGLCVWANDGWTWGNYDINISGAGQWTGAVSNNWNNPNNWSPNVVPSSTDDVTIETGYDFFPIVSTATAYCNNLFLGSGAKLRVAGQDLNVGGNLIVYGQLEETSSAADIIVAGNIIWETGSTANFNADGALRMYDGNWVFKHGANAVLANGTVYFEGINTTNIKSYESNCAFNNVVNNKIAGMLSYSESTDTLRINGAFTNSNSTSWFDIYADDPLVLMGALNNTGHLHCHAGKLIFGGTTPSINLNTGDYFNHIAFRGAGTTTLADSLRVKGNLVIESGSLATADYPIILEGNWSNNAGPSGFSCGTGDMFFSGSSNSDILTNETFYHMIVEKTSAGADALELKPNKTLHVLANLSLNDGSFMLNGMAVLDVDQDLQIANGAGMNADASSLATINVGRHWFNYNPDYSLTHGFNPGVHSQVTFDGTGDQFLVSGSSAYEEFNVLKINKTSGNFRPFDNVRCNKDIILQNGTWKDFSSGLTHYVYRNFTVEPAGSFLNESTYNTLVFMGSGNSLLTYAGTTGSIHNLGVSKTGGFSVTQVGNISTGASGNLTIYQGTYDLAGHQLLVTGTVSINSTGLLSLPAGSLLMLSNNSSLLVNDGGKLDIAGTYASPVEIRGRLATDRYFFNVNPNGIIAAEHCTFKQTAEGVNVHFEAFVDPLHSFTACTFREGASGGTLLRIDNAQVIVIDSARFPANTWSGASNVTKSMPYGHVTFTNYTGAFAGEGFDNDPYEFVEWTPGTPVVPVSTAVSGIVGSGEVSCFNATGLITVSEAPETFTLLPAGSATFISGGKILFKPGAKVFAGGYMHGYITTTGDYCGSLPASMVSATGEDEGREIATEGSSFIIYPNPSPGKFTLAPGEGQDNQGIRVDVYTMHGKRMVSKEIAGEMKPVFDLSGAETGIYFVHVIAGEKSETLKLIISR